MSTEIRKSQKYIAQKQAKRLGTHCPYYGQQLPNARATDAHSVGCGCPSDGHKQTMRRVQADHAKSIETPTDELKNRSITVTYPDYIDITIEHLRTA